jgi:hypothetical protein
MTHSQMTLIYPAGIKFGRMMHIQHVCQYHCLALHHLRPFGQTLGGTPLSKGLFLMQKWEGKIAQKATT